MLPPEPHAIAVMALTVVALFLFTRDRIPIETSSLAVIALLAILFSLFPFEREEGALDPVQFFAGFGNEALVAICALMMASQGLVSTGALAPVGRLVSRVWVWSPIAAMGVVLSVTAVISAFTNNTPQVVLMIPILSAAAIRSGTSPSKVLMPMAFAAQIGGMGTPIGTSLNLLVIGTAASLGLPRFHMFDFIQPAALAAIPGLLYLWLVAPRILPKRETAFSDVSPRLFEAQLHLGEESPAVGKTLGEAKKLASDELSVQAILRQPDLSIAPLPDVVLKPGDRLVLRDTSDRLMAAAHALASKLYSGDEPVDDDHELVAKDQQTAELVITPASPIRGRTLERANLEWRYKVIPLAVHRPGELAIGPHSKKLKDVRLGTGDVLLVQGAAEHVQALKRRNEVLVLDATSDVPLTKKAPIAMTIMASIVLIASLRLAPVAIAAVCGVLAMIVTGCLKWRDATRVLDTPMIMLTVASLALSLALVVTGGAAYIAQLFMHASSGLTPAMTLSVTILLMAVLSNIISNSAAAVIGTPIAVELARLLGVAPEPFVLAVLFGCNMAYATQMADNCNLLVYSAGNHRFNDFVRTGAPLTIIMWLAFSWILPQFYPLQPN